MAESQPMEQSDSGMDYEPEHREVEHQHQHQHDQQQQQNDDEEPESPPQPPALNTLYYDCLERIFDFLDLTSLLNVAQTCKQLQSAAATKFGHQYGHKTVYLYRIISNSLIRYQPGIQVYQSFSGYLRVNGLEFCYPFIRCFGAEITRLEVDYNNVLDAHKHHLDDYINQYCADTLVRFAFRNGHAFANENFTKPFKHVEEVSTSYCNFGASFMEFPNWFPNLQHLRIVRMVIDENAIAVRLPHLKQFDIYIVNNTHTDFTTENVDRFFHANPQLETIEMYFCEFRLSELLNIMRENRMISSVVLDGEIIERNEEELNRFRSERPLIVKFEIRNSVNELD